MSRPVSENPKFIREQKLKDNKEPEVYDEYNPEENYDQQKSNEKFDEMGSRERDTQNLSVTQLIDNNAQDEKDISNVSKSQNNKEQLSKLTGENMKDIGVTESNNVRKESADEPQHLDPNIIDNIHAEEGKFPNEVNPNGEKSGQSAISGKLIKKRGVGLLDLGVLNFTNQVDEGVEKEVIPCCIIRSSNKWRMRWEVLIMASATFNGFMTPYFIAFEPKFEFTQGWDQINILIDLIFIIDIFVKMRTTFINEVISQEIVDPREIMVRYLKKQVFIDILAAIPIDYFAYCTEGETAEILMYLGALRLFRLLKMADIASVVNLPDFLKNFVRLINLIFALTLYCHISACAWFIVLNQNKEWMPPLDYVWVKTNFYEQTPFFKYSMCLYYVVNIQIGNEIGPRGMFQLLYLSVLLLMSAFINATIFGNITVILQVMNRKSAILNEKLDTASSTMMKLQISDTVQHKIKEYLLFTQSSCDQQKDMETFMSMLSPSLKLEVTREIFDDCILENKVFEKKIEVLDFILQDLVMNRFLPEDPICRQGDVGSNVFFIASGSCTVSVIDQQNKECECNILKKNAYFGEIALIKNCKRTASVKSLNYVTCAEVNKAKFDVLVTKFPFVLKNMNAGIKEYKDRFKKIVLSALKGIDVFKDKMVDEEFIENVSYDLDYVNYNDGSKLFSEGDECTNVKIILGGNVEIFMNRNNVDIYCDTLYCGCSIGTYTFLSNCKYAMRAEAKSDVLVLVLTKDIFDKYAKANHDFKRLLVDFEKYVLINGLPLLDYKLFRPQSNEMHIFQKCQSVVRRLIRINKSYKLSDQTNINNKVLNADMK